ncbi:MAG: hypothetical protein AAFP84_18100 [Actinomycetota bacterium]
MLRYDTPIETRADFANFLSQMADDFANNPEAWEPTDIADLLDRMASYAAQPLVTFTANMRAGQSAEQASWRRFADIIAGARVYE